MELAKYLDDDSFDDLFTLQALCYVINPNEYMKNAGSKPVNVINPVTVPSTYAQTQNILPPN